MTVPLATNVDDAYHVCNPEKPLQADDDRYVDLAEVRGMQNFTRTISRRISRTCPEFHKQLITGHRGCGKSTELLRLKAELERERFFTVYLDVEEILDLGEIDYLDVLLAIARATEESLCEKEIGMDEGLLADIYDWFAETVFSDENKQDMTLKFKGEVQAGGKISFLGKLLASLTGDIHSGSSRRETTRRKLERELGDFITRLNSLIGEARKQVQQQGHKDFVILVDGLEKMQYRLLEDKQSTHAVLFMHHAEQLKAPACHIVYTVPISLASNANLGAAFSDSVMVMPMAKYMEPEGERQLIEIITRRIDADAVFADKELLKKLVYISGGAVRDLMRLVRLACEGGERITLVEIQQAVNITVREYDRFLRDKDLDTLRKVAQNKRVQADEEYARLLNLRVILEYQNGNRWADLHPAVREISWVREALGTDTGSED
ncbi:MAG: AAA family ATPase [Gammaproteobacteria bacterium]|nr:AAA family ATPase [Gammaproteobacteria bacterium]